MQEHVENWATFIEAAPQKFRTIGPKIWLGIGPEAWLFDSSEEPRLAKKGKLPERVGEGEVILSGPSAAFEKLANKIIVPAEALLNGELEIKGNAIAQLELHKFFEALLED